jgi:molybdate transport system substrate-binding protein
MMIKLIASALLVSVITGPAFAVGEACEPISIFAAASTTDALEKVASAYEQDSGCSVSTIFSASGTLARQIEAGAPADLYLSANIEWMDWVQNAGLVRRQNRTNLLGNQLVFIVPAEETAARIDIQDKAGVLAFLGGAKLAIGDPIAVPAGRYASLALKHFGLGAVEEKQTVRSSSVRAALTWVSRGEARAGIVYRTDAYVENNVRVAGTIPRIDGIEIVYPLALIGRTPNSAAQAFYEYLLSYEAASTFAEYGFNRVSAE